ncbi:MAG: SpoIIE family protein phosphatase [Acidobacteriota bacterium]|nr:SpoIIE family protein phosphatase [Acidobacteriota bacterium]
MESGILVTVQENTDVSAARRAVIKAAEEAGFGESLAGAAAIVATEAASNLLKHAGGGEFLVHRTKCDDGYGLEILALDSGPGLIDQELCFTDGYSTVDESAGTGLGAIKRLSRFCDIYSTAAGTVLISQFGAEPGKKLGIHLGFISIPYPGEDVCGDTCTVQETHGRVRIILADGLGHGISAFQASQAAVGDIADPEPMSPEQALQAAHQRSKFTRGSAASVADLDFAEGTVDYAGLGNVAGAIVSAPALRRQMISLNGTLGYEVHSIQQHRYPLAPDALVILHSDGLSTNWALDKYPGLFQRHPSVIAAVLIRDFRRTRDDATVVVVRARSAGST